MAYPHSINEIKAKLQAVEYPPKNDTAREPIIEIISLLIELCDHIESAQASAYHANNTADCLANGILPD